MPGLRRGRPLVGDRRKNIQLQAREPIKVIDRFQIPQPRFVGLENERTSDHRSAGTLRLDAFQFLDAGFDMR